MTFDIHGISGLLAISAHAVRFIRALAVLRSGGRKSLRSFHKFAVLVWLIWLVPYFSPMFFQLARP